ncbi:MAG: hypothetical protein L0Y56_17950, partial [Nitrospira sp.]|nr:hypothetical protein [Nitrospira sp.]
RSVLSTNIDHTIERRALALSSDWREALGTSPDSEGQGKPELTEARRAEGIPEGSSRPSVVGGSAPKPRSSARARASQRRGTASGTRSVWKVF